MPKLSGAEKAALKLLKRTVKDRMSAQGVEIHDARTLVARVRRRFERRKARVVIVRQGDRLAGMLAPQHLPEQPAAGENERAIGDLDLPPLQTLAPGDNVIDALETMLRQGHRALPVQKATGKIAGLLRRKDLVKVERALWANADSHLLLETGYDHNKAEYKGPSIPDAEVARDPAHPRCDILLYVPDDRLGRFIDAATGGYGYSHAAIDCGEVQRETGKPLIIEGATSGVRRDLLESHGARPYARISLLPQGVDPEAFYQCVRTKIGEPYDYAEAFTAGWFDSPVKQICSDLITLCLPDALREAIVAGARAGGMRPGAVAERHRTHDFISPNGFADYFGAPRGEAVTPDFVVAALPAGQGAWHGGLRVSESQ